MAASAAFHVRSKMPFSENANQALTAAMQSPQVHKHLRNAWLPAAGCGPLDTAPDSRLARAENEQGATSGPFEVLVDAAPAHEISEDVWDSVIDSSLEGIF